MNMTTIPFFFCDKLRSRDQNKEYMKKKYGIDKELRQTNCRVSLLINTIMM